MSWSVPYEWEGETVYVIGGGPSLRGFDWERLRGKRVIATNNSGFRVPWADVMYWADLRWYEWNKDRLSEFKGKYLVTKSRPPKRDDLDIKVIQHRFHGLSHDPSIVAGWCGGSNAINLAYLFGATRIILLGFDMTGGNFHNEHRVDTIEDFYKAKFIPAIELMAKHLGQAGIEVINANPSSQLKCFPIVNFDDISDNTRTEDRAR